jgi:hypothetical protein
MVLRIGQMRSVVRFLTNNPVPLGQGRTDKYGILINTRGRLRIDSGNRSLSFGMIVGEDSYTLTCRFQENLESLIKVNGKVMIDEKFYTIASWEKVDQINHIYIFKLNETKHS